MRLATVAEETSMQPAQAVSLPVAASRSNTVLQAVLAMALGLFVVFMVGFSHIDAVHNATHDVRHSNAFPCH
jgi:cobalt transporter subunit CbtB